MRKFKQVIFVFSALLILFAQFSCQKKQNIENTDFLKKAEVTDSYKKYLLVLWRDLDPQKEDILKLANQQDSVGGITLAEINLMEDKADQMVKKNLLIWEPITEKYKITKIGKDVLERGAEVKEQEFSEKDVLNNEQK
jgi:hypothetical protein